MAAKFLILTTTPAQIETRVAISAIESYTYTRRIRGGNLL